MTAGAGMSVVVPTCARIQALERCLGALAAQATVRGDLEVVVSIDGPDPEPAAVHAAAPAGLELRVLQADRTGPAGARNRAAQVASGALLAFVDDDCEPAPGWAAALASALTADPQTLAGGPVVNAYPRDSSAAASHAVLAALYESPPQAFLAGANIAMHAEVFAAMGGFDETFPTAAGEDRELCARAVDRGMRIVYVPRAAVRHHRPSGPRHLWRQYVEYGRGARRLDLRRASAGQEAVRAGRGFPRALALTTLRAAREARSPAVVPLVGLTQLATAWGYARERR
jgi:GT2 family glycosyltransferase